MYGLFHDGEEPAGLSRRNRPRMTNSEARQGSRLLRQTVRLLAKMEPGDQKLLLYMAQKVARD